MLPWHVQHSLSSGIVRWETPPWVSLVVFEMTLPLPVMTTEAEAEPPVRLSHAVNQSRSGSHCTSVAKPLALLLGPWVTIEVTCLPWGV